ncbi:MAG: class I SAM-dependent methyltransferase [Acetobacteraceae bacterium]
MSASSAMMTSFASAERQSPYRAAIVIPTVLRPSLLRAVRSVFAQELDGRIQVLIGVDRDLGGREVLATLARERPAHVDLDVLDPGYSTARAHGGLHSCAFGGSLRAALTLLANSRHVAYLDDDNWIGPDHLATLLATIEGVEWAFCRRHMVDPRTEEPICVDEWESVGPGEGFFNRRFGGFVDPNCLMIDKIACHDVVGEWAISTFDNGGGEDRRVFDLLRTRHKGRGTRRATSYYLVNEADPIHAFRTEWFRSQGYEWKEQRRVSMTLGEAMHLIHPVSPYAGMAADPALLDLQGWESSDSPAFAEVFRQLRPRAIIEVGVWKGRSAVHMAELARSLELDTIIVCVDTWLGGLDHLLSEEWRGQLRMTNGRPRLYAVFAANVVHHGLTERIIPFAQTSTTAAAFLLRCGVEVDLLHIDASHEEADVLADCRAWWKVLRKGGVLIGDDYTQAWPAVVNAAHAFADETGCTLQVGGVAPFQKWVVQKPA